ncbi:uncharacterized protein [Dermacentor albipictus]|uniref:uncharacterized protein isoform X4 n=1 Tax=Dermacentor albipictus TaxID=60249 RepID=UPI0038FC40FC
MGDDTSFYSQQEDPNDYASSVYSVEDFPTSETAISSQADDRGGQPSFVVCLFCLLFLGIVALIIFLMSTVIIDIDDRDDGAGGGGGDVKDDIKDVPYPGTIYSKPTVTKPVTSRPSPRRPATTPPVSTAAPSRPTPPVSSTLPPTVVLPPVSTTSSNARIKSTGYSRRSPLTTPTTTTGATTTTTKKKATTTARMSTTPTTSTSRFPELRQMLCSVGRTAIAETMYPPEGLCTYLFYTDVVIVDAKIVAAAERNSWNLFQTKAKKYNTIKSGIAFDHRYISTKLISEAMGELTMLATNKIGSYGLLNIITKPTVLHQTVLALRPAIEALKNIQGSDPGKTTVIAIGSYDYSGSGFMAKYKDIFAEVVGTFKADIVIAISSVGSMEDEANCYAAPPNVLTSPILRFPSMICTFSKNVDKKNQWLKEPYMVYGTYIHNNTKRHVAFSEYFTSVREKYTKAVRIFGSLHHRSALLMFNVHLGDVRKKCSVDAFSAIQWICHDFLGQRSCG